MHDVLGISHLGYQFNAIWSSSHLAEVYDIGGKTLISFIVLRGGLNLCGN